MSSALEKHIPLLEGSNYHIWADAMQSYLRSQGLWQITIGNKSQPSIPAKSGPPTASNNTAIATANKERQEWNNKDDQAFGLILLHVQTQLHNIVSSKVTARQAWSEYRTAFRTAQPTSVYSDFRQTIMMKIPVNNPAVEISRMATIFGRLLVASVALPALVQAIILLAACLREYESVSSHLLQSFDNSTLTFNIVKNAIVNDAQHCIMISKHVQPPVLYSPPPIPIGVRSDHLES